MDTQILPKPSKHRIKHDVESYFDADGKLQYFLRITWQGKYVGLVQTLEEAFQLVAKRLQVAA